MQFIRAQFSAFIGGISDYLIMLACVELLGMHYIPGIVIGGLVGAVINYSISRTWAFSAKEEGIASQFGKYAIVSMGSIILKSSGTFVFTDIIGLDYRISKLIIDGIVAFGVNYTLQKFWVFKEPSKSVS
jgi:putative flippase GtrA